MLASEFPQLIIDTKAELENQLEQLKELNRKWETNYSLYSKINSRLMDYKWDRTTNLFDVRDFNRLEKEVKEFRLEIEKYKGRIWFWESMDNQVYGGEYDGSAELEFRFWYYEVTELVSEYLIKTVVKEKVAEKLFEYVKANAEENSDWIYQRNIDCKILILFKDGTIEWKALASLTYTDCQL